MNVKNIKKHMTAKMKDWLESIEDENVKKIIRENTIITGGALVSLLTGEKVHDYDVYLRTKEACEAVAHYYAAKWNAEHDGKRVTVQVLNEVTPARIRMFISSAGVVEDKENSPFTCDDCPFPAKDENETDEEYAAKVDAKDGKDKPKYRPVFISSNAITLSDRVQVVTRFYGEVDKIHENYDFAHCTCSWTSWDNAVQLPTKALECIINKELYYIGSKYPLCSIIRTRKYLEKGYHINAGQYVKMALQLNELDLNNIEVLEEQLCGVDSSYFAMVLLALRNKMEHNGEQIVDKMYLFELINRMF